MYFGRCLPYEGTTLQNQIILIITTATTSERKREKENNSWNQ